MQYEIWIDDDAVAEHTDLATAIECAAQMEADGAYPEVIEIDDIRVRTVYPEIGDWQYVVNLPESTIGPAQADAIRSAARQIADRIWSINHPND